MIAWIVMDAHVVTVRVEDNAQQNYAMSQGKSWLTRKRTHIAIARSRFYNRI